MEKMAGANDSHPWARRDQLGYVKAFLDNTSEIITQPVAFFGKVNPKSPMGGSLIYGIIISFIGMLFGAFWQFSMRLVMGSQMGSSAQQLIGLTVTLVVLVLSPVLILVGIMIGAGIFHLLLLMFNWSDQPFGATVKAVAFSGVSGLANAIPLCGGFIGSIWGIVLVIIGLQELHNLSTGRAVTVALIPVVAIFLCICLAAFLVALAPQFAAM